MKHIAIVGGGPAGYVPDLSAYSSVIDYWIGADRGALTITEQGMVPHLAIGDFDSVSASERKTVEEKAVHFQAFPNEKDESDLDLAVRKALEYQPEKIFFFGVTGGRLDHSLANIQLLYRLQQEGSTGIIMDTGNQLELAFPGQHEIVNDACYTNISFLPFSQQVTGINLTGFYYPLESATIHWGSTLCISNKLLSEKGTFSFKSGILIVIKSRDILVEEK